MNALPTTRPQEIHVERSPTMERSTIWVGDNAIYDIGELYGRGFSPDMPLTGAISPRLEDSFWLKEKRTNGVAKPQ